MVDATGGIGSAGGLPPNLARLDPYLLLEVLSSNRAQALQQSTQDQANQIEAKNEQIRKLNDALERLNAAKTSKDEKGNDIADDKQADVTAAVDELNRLGVDTSGFLKKNDDGKWEVKKDQGMTLLIENVKTQIDTVSSDSQLDLIKLQGLINKQSEAEQLASGAENKRDQTSTAIIQKIT
jgi:hypothetical protein